MDKIDSDGENKKQRPYRCCSSYALSKPIMDDRLEDLWRRENPDSPEFTCYQGSRIDRIYADIKIANNNKINHIIVSFTNYYNANSIDRLPSKTKIEKYSWYFNNILWCKSKVSSATKTFLFLLKTNKKKAQLQWAPGCSKIFLIVPLL